MAFFAFVLILPSVLLSMLTLVIFCLPPDSTDKINIGRVIQSLCYLTVTAPTEGDVQSCDPVRLSVCAHIYILDRGYICTQAGGYPWL